MDENVAEDRAEEAPLKKTDESVCEREGEEAVEVN